MASLARIHRGEFHSVVLLRFRRTVQLATGTDARPAGSRGSAAKPSSFGGPTMIRSIVFDVDGVLIRDGEFARILSDQYGLTVERTAPFFRGPFQDCVIGKADLQHAILPFLDEWAWPGSVTDLLKLWFEADSCVNGQVLDLVGELRTSGIRCFVASTQERHRAAYVEHQLGFGERFDGLFFSWQLGLKKPDRAFFTHVAGEIGHPPTQILFFDDHESNVLGARDAGWSARRYQIGDDISLAAIRA